MAGKRKFGMHAFKFPLSTLSSLRRPYGYEIKYNDATGGTAIGNTGYNHCCRCCSHCCWLLLAVADVVVIAVVAAPVDVDMYVAVAAVGLGIVSVGASIVAGDAVVAVVAIIGIALFSLLCWICCRYLSML